jgi:hypothetical protein
MRSLAVRRWVLFLGISLSLVLVSVLPAQPPGDKAAAQDKATEPDQAVAKWVDELVKKLGDKNKTVRESAGTALVSVGKPALPQLKKLAGVEDPDQAEVAEGLIKRIENGGMGPGGMGGFGGGGPGGKGGFGPPGGPGGKGGKGKDGFGPPGGPDGKGGFGPGGKGGFGGGFGSGATRLEDVKKQIDARDEEWKVIGPKLQKVITARQVLTTDSRPAGGPGGMPFGGGAATGPVASNVVSQAQADLKTTLSDSKHTATDVEEKVAAVRKAREKAQADLDTAQQELRLLLTVQQQAVLVSLGYLD